MRSWNRLEETMNRNGKKTTLIFMALLLVVAGPIGCGGGGGGGDSSSGTPAKTPPKPTTQQGPAIMLASDKPTVRVGEDTVQTIEVKSLQDAYYAAFDVRYDPQVLEYRQAEEGGFLKSDGSSGTIFQVALVDGDEGRLKVGIARLATSSGIDGDGTLAKLTFKAIGAGSPGIAFMGPNEIRNFNDQKIGVLSWKPSGVNVVQ
jgi:hypothetical protein